MEQLIIKYLEGNLTLDEQHELSKWIQRDERNAKVFNTLYTYWHNHHDTLDREELEVRLRLLGMMKEGEVQPVRSKRNRLNVLFKVAAIITIVISSLFGLYLFNARQEPDDRPADKVTFVEKVSLPGQKITTLLPDGTRVKLNADSRLITPTAFGHDKREVTLIGEAFFEVKRDEARPFIIKTSKVDVQVLGTSFDVKVYQDGTLPLVAVKSGKVAVKSRETEEEIHVVANEMVFVSENNLVKATIKDSAEPFAWVDKKMVFDNESLSSVLKQISRWYGVEIDISSNITSNKKYTASYQNPTLAEVMDILAFVYDFKYRYDRKENKVTIQ